jgi:hypothetical protein
MASEIKQMISLIKAVKQNYKFIDPIDNDNGIEDKTSFVTVDQAKNSLQSTIVKLKNLK